MKRIALAFTLPLALTLMGCNGGGGGGPDDPSGGGCGGPIDEDPTQQVATAGTDVCAMALGGGRVYWRTSSGVIATVAKDGGKITTIATGQTLEGGGCELVADTGRAYWPVTSAVRAGSADGAPVDLVADDDAYGVTLDGDDLVWWGFTGAKRMPKAGGAVETLETNGVVTANAEGLFSYALTCAPEADGYCSAAFTKVTASNGALPFGAKSGDLQRCGDGFCYFAPLGSNQEGIRSSDTGAADFQIATHDGVFTSDARTVTWAEGDAVLTRELREHAGEATRLSASEGDVVAMVSDDEHVFWFAVTEERALLVRTTK